MHRAMDKLLSYLTWVNSSMQGKEKEVVTLMIGCVDAQIYGLFRSFISYFGIPKITDISPLIRTTSPFPKLATTPLPKINFKE